jgi:hypothetical protein
MEWTQGSFDINGKFIRYHNLSPNERYTYAVITGSILFFFTVVMKIELGHVLAAVIIFVVLFLIIDSRNTDTLSFTSEMTRKLDSLQYHNEKFEFLCEDPDLINLLYDIKINFEEYNRVTFKRSLQQCNRFLQDKQEINKKLIEQPTVFNSNDNGFNSEETDPSKMFKTIYKDKTQDKCPENAIELFSRANESGKLFMNYIHSLIYSIPSTPVTHIKHDEVLERAHLLVKRNLDEVKDVAECSSSGKKVTNYDSSVPYNLHSGDIFENVNYDTLKAPRTFNFY